MSRDRSFDNIDFISFLLKRHSKNVFSSKVVLPSNKIFNINNILFFFLI